MRNVIVDYADVFNDNHNTVLVTTLSHNKLVEILDEVTKHNKATILDVTKSGDKKCKVKIDFSGSFELESFLNKVSPSFIDDAKRRKKEYEEAKENATLS